MFKEKGPPSSKFESFSVTKAKLAKYAKQAATTALQQGLQTGLTVASGAATTTVSIGVGTIAIFPLGAALGPWLAALVISSKASGIFALHDLRDSAKGTGDTHYSCTCGKCVENLTYVIDKKEYQVGVLAVGVFTAGLAIIADRLNSVRKSFQKNRPKEKICQGFVAGSRGGCICAIASIMMIAGGWKDNKEKDDELVVEMTAITWSSDGHERLKSKW
ncbi:MAG: hypothetical protein FJX54_18145 [Alphaproteobacteria bacterium]|nr:hypothetical protein [Alphaproteobacteria bacterium]